MKANEARRSRGGLDAGLGRNLFRFPKPRLAKTQEAQEAPGASRRFMWGSLACFARRVFGQASVRLRGALGGR